MNSDQVNAASTLAELLAIKYEALSPEEKKLYHSKLQDRLVNPEYEDIELYIQLPKYLLPIHTRRMVLTKEKKEELVGHLRRANTLATSIQDITSHLIDDIEGSDHLIHKHSVLDVHHYNKDIKRKLSSMMAKTWQMAAALKTVNMEMHRARYPMCDRGFKDKK